MSEQEVKQEQTPPILQNKPLIQVGLPCPNHAGIKERTKKALAKLEACPLFETKVIYAYGTYVDQGRNQTVNFGNSIEVKQKGMCFDYFLSLDADIVFEPEQVFQLLNHNLPIVSGAYPARGNKWQYVAGMFDKDGLVTPDDFFPISTKGLIKVDWAGAGFTLIKKEVFEKMNYPWYKNLYIEVEKGGRKMIQQMGEDIGFSLGAKKAGIEMYCDFNCVLEHLTGEDEQTSKNYTPDELAELAGKNLTELRDIMQVFYNAVKNNAQ